MEETESKRQIALSIAIEAGVLERCEYHEHCIYLGDSDIEDAYKLGNAKVSAGDIDAFESRREMTDMIKSVVEEYWDDECAACKKWEDE